MPKTEFSLKFQTVENNNSGYPAVIVAAGSSSRMCGTDKQFSLLGGIPVLARTLRAFENCAKISEITVVTREEKIADIEKLAKSFAISKLKNVVVGGSCREESVKNGLILYKDSAEKVLIHDGARPLVSDKIITAVSNALTDSDSVTCAVKLKDTIKQINSDSIAVNTPDRTNLVAVQTPQGVNVGVFLSVAENSDLSSFTDDTSVMESVGKQTLIVEGDYTNIKITTPEDLAVAEAFIRKEWEA